PILKRIGELAGVEYGKDDKTDISMRIIADHIRTSTFILGDQRGCTPSNVGQGYILRRLIRRAVRNGRHLGIQGTFLAKVAEIVIDLYGAPYPELVQNKDKVFDELTKEEIKFSETLEKGEKQFEKMTFFMEKQGIKEIAGGSAFKLYDTFGFPIELTQELAAEKGFTVDVKGFNEAFAKHQELSRTAEAGQFKSGLGDHSEETTALHTATHLLHAALRKVLGDHVGQKGSNITPERLRFDFSHGEKMTKEQIQQVEDLVNDAIKRDLQVSVETMTPQEAVEKGAVAFFSSKYGEQVTVYTIGDFSKEVCAGPHVKHTGDMGHFHILKEESSSSGVRRIKAVLEK
ncbi:MAG: alanine--tRNA ligase, partial [Spirochaetia bacterium]|nr:alanine--tRNA ligase [Spirochaetia bacterium]